jgi:hypothetical protein
MGDLSDFQVRQELHKSNILGRAAIAKLHSTLKGNKDGMMIIQPGHLTIRNM